MANNLSQQQKDGVLMDAEELAQWRDDYNNAQGWANEDQLNQQQREETKMAYEVKDNEVTLWPQEKKSEKSPPYSGKGLVNGKEVRAAMWKNTSRDGKIYLKLKFSDPQDMGTREAPPRDEDFDF